MNATHGSRKWILVAAVLIPAAACGRHILHAGATAKPVAPPAPVPIHSDGTCDPGLDPCQGSGAGYCFDLQAAPDHCGACGNACALGSPCDSGQCRVVACTQQLTVKVIPAQDARLSVYQIALADLDRDGMLDMLAPPFMADNVDDIYRQVGVFRGQGDGTFVLDRVLPTTLDAGFSVVAADLNRDQIPDLVMAAPTPAGTTVPSETDITIVARLGNGDGTFGPELGLPAGAGPVGIVVADLNGDGKPDLANIADRGKRVSVYVGNGDGTFANRQDLPVSGSPTWLKVTDWNADGIPDLVAADQYVHVMVGTGAGHFARTLDCGLTLDTLSGPAGPPVLADFDRDGRVDLVSSNAILLGMDECNFTRQTTYSAAFDAAFPLTAGDFNGDGAPDLAFADWEGIWYVPGDGQGNLGKRVKLGVTDDDPRAQPDSAAGFVGDVNGDGRLDFVVANRFTLRVFLNTCR